MEINLKNILEMDGIVIRKIPETVRQLTRLRENQKLKEGEKIVRIGVKNTEYVEKIKKNSMGGLYLVGKQMNQDSIFRFSKKFNGVGGTIESAYYDYLSKNRK